MTPELGERTEEAALAGAGAADDTDLLTRFDLEGEPIQDEVGVRPIPHGDVLEFDDAVLGPYRAFWRPTIQREIDSLFKYGVWTLEPLPPGALVRPCKMVLKVKPDGMDPPPA